MPRTPSLDGEIKPSSKPYDRKPTPKIPKAEGKPKPEPTAAAPSAWTPAECLALFDHVKRVGERQWEDAVPGRSGPVSRKAWKNRVEPFIRKALASKNGASTADK
ncbi:uncharacterized protein LOC62_06G008186 [Vanrija pseudolonga]|uniref:Myb-like domain-containing protein n=1 Tax=Vanrija pseudolonga TaxID=143232 RepID=A0AAF0YIM7_9TREE|nr:hypothetical protein LOC62_06G008186 [Vanrija pseudolonga]